MADELRLKIVLDDGSVKEGFLSVEKQADQTAKKVGASFDKKDKGINAAGDAAEGLASKFSQATGSVSGLASVVATSLGPIGAIGLAIGAVVGGLTKFALAGEQVNAVNTQFDVIARASKLNVDAFKDSIIESTQGLIDDEDALQIATKGMVALGDTASKLPKILDASRNVSRALGKDFKDTFENLSQFVETGNARILKNLGIVLDLDKAYKAAAKSVGLTAEQLNEQQKQTIRANLLLDEIPKKFGAAADSVTPLKDAFDRLKVSTGNLVEDIESKLAKAFTKTFIDKADLSNVGLTRLNEKFADTSAQIKSLNDQIDNIKADKLASKSVEASVRVSELNDEIKKLRDEQAKLFAEGSAKSDQQLFAQLDASRAAPAVKEKIVVSPEQQKAIFEARKLKEQELTNFLTNEDLKRVNNSIQIDQIALAETKNLDQQKLLSISILNKQLEAENIQNKLNIDSINKQFKGTELIDLTSKHLAIEAATQTHEDNISLIKKRAEQDRIKSKKAADAAALSATSNALSTIATLQENASGELAAIGKAAAITKATIDGYVAVQNALAEVPYPYNFVAAGLVGVAAAANVAKIAGVGGGGGNGGFDSGGGIAATPSAATDNQPIQNLTRQEANTAVSVVIQGDVLDSDASGSRIVDLINTAFDKKGVVINNGAFA